MADTPAPAIVDPFEGQQSAAAPSSGIVDPFEKQQQPEGALASMAKPITSLPETYENTVHGAVEQVKQGVKQLGEGTLGGVGKGLGNVALGGLSYLSAPVTAPLSTFVGQPTERLAKDLGASERLASALGAGAEGAAGFALPAPKGLPKAVPKPPPEAPFGVHTFPYQRPGATLGEQRAVQDALRLRSGEEAGGEATTRLAEQQAQLAEAPNVAASRLSPTGDVLAESPHDAGQTISDVLNQQRQATEQAQQLRNQNLNAERERLRASYAPNNRVLASNPQEGADIVQGGLSREEERYTARRDAAYDAANDAPGQIKPKPFVNIKNDVLRTFNDPDRPFLTSPENTPNTLRVLDRLDQELGEPARAAMDPANTSFVPFTPARINNIRKILNSYWQDANTAARATSNYSDVTGVGRVIDEFDNAVSKGFRNNYEGGNGRQVAQLWDDARAAHRDLRQTFSRQGSGDVVGPFIQKVLGQREGQALAPEQIVSGLTGSNGVQIGRRLQQIFGPNSPEIGAVKQMLWSRAIEPVEGQPALTAAKVADNIDKLRNSDLGQLYFTPQERAAMQGHAASTRASIPVQDTSVLGRTLVKAEGATPQELADMIVPRGAVYDKAGAQALAQHLMQTATPEEQVAIKQGLFHSLIETPAGPSSARVVNQINKAFSRGQDVMNTLYTPEDQAMIKEYRDMHKQLTVPQNIPQWSNHPNYVQAGVKAMAFYVGRQLAKPLTSNIPFGEDVAGLAAAKLAGRTTDKAKAREVRRLMQTGSESMAEYQKAVAAANRTRLPMYEARAAVRGAAVVDSFKKLGINLNDWMSSPTPAAADQSQQKAEGGAVNRPFGGGVDDPESNPISAAIMQHPVLQMGVGPGFTGAQAPGAAPMPKPAEEAPAAPAEPTPPLYSAMEKAVQAAPHEAASGEQWTGYLKNQPGVKSEELDQVGMPLFGPATRNAEGSIVEGPITKDQLLQHIGENKLQLDEKELRGDLKLNYNDVANIEAELARNHPEWDEDRLEGELQREIAHREFVANDNTANPRYSNYQMPGGENYRELLLKMPPKAPELSPNGMPPGYVLTNHGSPGFLLRDQRPGLSAYERRFPTSEEALRHKQEMPYSGINATVVQLPEQWSYRSPHVGSQMFNSQEEAVADAVRSAKAYPDQAQFHSAHWPDDPNVLLHMRMNDRDIPDVGKTLHLEELQSDWHQKGRKQGYQGDAVEEPQHWQAYYTAPAHGGGDGVEVPIGYGTTREEALAQADPGWRGVVDIQTRQVPVDSHAAERARSQQVLDAPFKTTWPELGLKRAIAKAAQEGYDAISWTPGQQQADRYDLSKHVDELWWHPESHNLQAYKNGKQIIDKEVSPDSLADHVGKDVAQKLQDAKPDENGSHVIEGKDLRVGGEGMKGFYDKMLPNIANKIGKKYGAQVEWKPLGGNSDYVRTFEDLSLKTNSGNITRQYNSAIAALKRGKSLDEVLNSGILSPKAEEDFQAALANAKREQVPVLRLTPKLKEQALQNGLPMFARGGAIRGEQTANSSTGANPATAMSGGVFAAGGTAKYKDAKDPIVRIPKEQDDKSQHKRPTIDASHDVVSGADSSSRRIIIDRHIPRKDYKPLAAHEEAERKGMQRGMSYETAHHTRGDPAERHTVEAKGGNWKHYSEHMAGLLSHIEHEHVNKPPPKGQHIDPYKAIDRAKGGRVVASNVDKSPTGAQKVAGNYQKDHVNIHGLDISIENAKGHIRTGVSHDGKKWSSVLPAHYGYIRRTEGADGDHVDVYLGPHLKSPKVWIVDQVDVDTKGFDEHKAFLGFGSKQQVINTYLKAFSDGKGKERIGNVKELSVAKFKDWLKNGDTTQPIKEGIIPTKSGRITRNAFLYLSPKPPKDKFAQCKTCTLWTGGGCLVHDPVLKVAGDMTCGVYIPGSPQFNMRGHEKPIFTPEQSGLLNSLVQCQRCLYTSGNEDKSQGCGLYRMLNQRQPEDFDLDPDIESEGCCNAWRSRHG